MNPCKVLLIVLLAQVAVANEEDGSSGPDRSIGSKARSSAKKSSSKTFPFPATPDPLWRPKFGPEMLKMKINTQNNANSDELADYYVDYKFEFARKNHKNQNFQQRLKENQKLQVELAKKAKKNEPVIEMPPQQDDKLFKDDGGGGPLTIG